jgi:hypothetical protein
MSSTNYWRRSGVVGIFQVLSRRHYGTFVMLLILSAEIKGQIKFLQDIDLAGKST